MIFLGVALLGLVPLLVHDVFEREAGRWTVQCDGVIDESQLDISEVATIAENAGAFIGLGDWRPRFGRFTATVEAVR